MAAVFDTAGQSSGHAPSTCGACHISRGCLQQSFSGRLKGATGVCMLPTSANFARLCCVRCALTASVPLSVALVAVWRMIWFVDVPSRGVVRAAHPFSKPGCLGSCGACVGGGTEGRRRERRLRNGGCYVEGGGKCGVFWVDRGGVKHARR